MNGAPITTEKIQEIIDKHFKNAKLNEDGIKNCITTKIDKFLQSYKKDKAPKKRFSNETLKIAKHLEKWAR